VLNITSGIDDLGGFQWELTGTLLLVWTIVYLIVWKGLHSSGKARFLSCWKSYIESGLPDSSWSKIPKG
jgi:hypothetical protein